MCETGSVHLKKQEAPKSIEKEILLVWNQQLFEKGIISKDIYLRAKSDIEKM